MQRLDLVFTPENPYIKPQRRTLAVVTSGELRWAHRDKGDPYDIVGGENISAFLKGLHAFEHSHRDYISLGHYLIDHGCSIGALDYAYEGWFPGGWNGHSCHNMSVELHRDVESFYKSTRSDNVQYNQLLEHLFTHDYSLGFAILMSQEFPGSQIYGLIDLPKHPHNPEMTVGEWLSELSAGGVPTTLACTQYIVGVDAGYYDRTGRYQGVPPGERVCIDSIDLARKLNTCPNGLYTRITAEDLLKLSDHPKLIKQRELLSVID